MGITYPTEMLPKAGEDDEAEVIVVPPMTDQQIVDKANYLANLFYGVHGNARPEGFKFHEATHPQERLMWRMAREAMIYLTNTDPDDALAALD